MAETEFDAWLSGQIAESGPFTVLVVLVAIGDLRVDLLRSTHLHAIGDEIAWSELAALFAGAGVPWNGAAFFLADPEAGGLVEDGEAKARLVSLVGRLTEDRLLLNEGHFFDRKGRRLRIDEATAH